MASSCHVVYCYDNWLLHEFEFGPVEKHCLLLSYLLAYYLHNTEWTASSEFGTYRLCEQRRFRRACASAQSRQNLRCSLIQAVNQEEPSDRKPDPWPSWMAGHVQLKFVITECSKTQIRLTQLEWCKPLSSRLDYYRVQFFAKWG